MTHNQGIRLRVVFTHIDIDYETVVPYLQTVECREGGEAISSRLDNIEIIQFEIIKGRLDIFCCIESFRQLALYTDSPAIDKK
ncbi:MAG: hypothetical protein DRP70_16900 [Spirochaetes bacterium]|nr:MAG: hypothetical protein DRP70_16900 [Spirochaetota bacterium]